MNVEGLMIDLSGTVYDAEGLIEGTREALERLKAMEMPVRYLTNSSRSTRTQIHERLEGLGLDIPEEEIVTAPLAVRQRLEEERLRPLLLVHPELTEEFSGIDQEDPNAVVLGDAGTAFTYARLNRAFRLLLDGAPLLAVGDNRYFRERDGMSLDAGPFVKALEYAAGIRSTILGKPSRTFFRTAAAELGCAPEHTLMVGDDVDSDVNGAIRAGLQGALVQTGKYRDGDERRMDEAGQLAENLAALIRRLDCNPIFSSLKK